MKKTIVALLVLTTCIFTLNSIAFADEACFDPSAQHYDVTGSSKINLWEIPAASGNAVWADSEQSWHTELSVTMWYATILRAQEMSMVVVVGYDPSTYGLWYIGKPISSCP